MPNNRLYIRDVMLKKGLPKQSYLNDIPAVQYLLRGNALSMHSNVTFFAGENGAGKSTLLEAIAVAYGFNPEGGSRNFTFATKHSHSRLWEYLTLTKTDFAEDGFFLRAESFYNVATSIESMSGAGLGRPVVDYYGGVSLHEQSHGESFLNLVEKRFGGKGLYILDEPEAALSPMRLLRLMSNIDRLVKNHSQFIIATHSPVLMAFPGAQVLWFDDRGVTETAYQNTEHYLVTKQFFENPERMLHYLLE